MKSTLTILCFLFLTISSYSQSSSEQEYNDYLAQLKVSHDATTQFYQDCDKIEEFEEEFNKMELILDEIEIFISSFDENTQWLVKYESLLPDSGYSPLRIFKMYHENSVLSPIEELKESQSFYVKLCSEMGADKTLKNEDEVIAIYTVYSEFEAVDKFYSDMSYEINNYFEILVQNMDDLTCDDLEEFESICNKIDKEVSRFKALIDSTVTSFKALPEAHQQIRIAYKTSKAFEDLPTDSEEELRVKAIQRRLMDTGKDYSLFETFMGLYAPLELNEIKFGGAARTSMTIMAVKTYYPDRMTVRLRELIKKGKDKKACK
jgi:hypothetical protein